MATGDQSDILKRLKELIPPGWFDDENADLRDAVLAGFSNSKAFSYDLIQFIKQQERISTASGGFLDLISEDFFGNRLPRKDGQTDASFRTSILATVFRDRVTRAALNSILLQLTGRAPVIFEPSHPQETGVYGGTYGLGYGVAGKYGSLTPQTFVTAYRPLSGSGLTVSDADIYAAIEAVRPLAYLIWVRISN